MQIILVHSKPRIPPFWNYKEIEISSFFVTDFLIVSFLGILSQNFESRLILDNSEGEFFPNFQFFASANPAFYENAICFIEFVAEWW